MILVVKSRESRDKSQAQIPRSGSRLSTLSSRPFHGFTLIELLIAVTIIAILASLVVGIAMVAGQTGREGKSRNMVERIHTLLVDHYNSFKTRRVELNPAVTTAIRGLSQPSAVKGKITAAARLFALREMMLMEVPDRWSDVLLAQVPATPGLNDAALPLYNPARTALSQTFLRRYLGLVGRINTITGVANQGEDIKRNQGAECLYMIVTIACGDGEARTQFHESDIGDADGDGAPEFLDAWGHPISFLRWAPGFDSPIQLDVAELNALTTVDQDKALAKDHDPFDMYRLQPNAFRLVPLVYSTGRDESESLGIALHVDYVPWRLSNSPVMPTGNTYPYFDRPLDPYVTVTSGPGAGTYLGADDGSKASTDNLHNHLIGRRL